jgi:hypothetical protein
MDNTINEFTANISLDDIKPLEIYKNRDILSNLGYDDRELLIRRGEKWIEGNFPQLSFSLYREYKETGNRDHFQTECDKRRFALNDVFFAEFVENKGRFLNILVEYLYETLSEVVWWLPAHNVYRRDGYNSGYPDPTKPIIALFCAETAAQVSIIINTFESKLPLELINYANCQLEERVFTPYENKSYWWMAEDPSFVNNWAPWCTQNVLLSYACSLNFKKDRMIRFIDKASKTLDCFLSSYGTDGCCEEGPQYYHVAGGSLFGAIEIINQCSSEKISSIYENEKLKNIAGYIQKVHISGPYFVNFGDCNSKAGDCNAKEYLFAKRVNNIELINFIGKNWPSVEDKLMIGERNLYERFLSIKYFKELDELSKTLVEIKLNYQEFTEFKSKGLYIFRSCNNTLAVQGGSNYQSHNHNDTGSFIYYKNNKPLIIDVGVEEYTEKSFSDLRYSIWTMRSSYHNLTNFEDVEQVFAQESKCIINNVTSSSISMELVNTYPKTNKIKSYIRNLKLESDELIVEDIIDSCMLGTLTLMVQSKVEIINNSTIKIDNNKVVIEGDVKEISCESIRVTDSRLKVSLPNTIYRITINYNHSILLRI